jgi:hypothetical protein
MMREMERRRNAICRHDAVSNGLGIEEGERISLALLRGGNGRRLKTPDRWGPPVGERSRGAALPV